MASAFARWHQDTEYYRLLDTDPARLWSAKKMKEWFEKDIENDSPTFVFFSIRTLAEDRLIGFIAFDSINWTDREAFVAIGIGERDAWGKGYGTDAMKIILRYAFTELNLARVSLSLLEGNARARRSYEKCGFKYEGRERQAWAYEGRRWDEIYMGLLCEEWRAMNNDHSTLIHREDRQEGRQAWTATY